MKTLAIIPAYNEQDNIISTIEDIRTHCPDCDYLVVNDCSRDKTKDRLRAYGARYISLPCNLGIGGGVQAGYQYALEHDYDIAFQFDGDGQHDARYVRALLEPILRGEADITIGSRFLEKEGFQSSGLRRVGISFLSRLIRFFCGITILDVTSGMRAVNRRWIERFSRDYAQDYPEPEAILAAGLQGARIREIPVRMKERKSGKSSISPIRSVYYMIKVSLALVVVRISSRRENDPR